MTIYFLTPIVAYFFSCALKRTKFRINQRDCTTEIFVALAFIIPFVIFAFRDVSIGIDTSTYCRDFEGFAQYSFKDLILVGYGEYERGFLIFCKLLSLLSKNPIVLLIGSSILINFLYARVICKQNSMALISMLTYFFLGNYLYNLNIMRQAIAVGIILNAVLFLYDREYVKYLFLVAIACTFHTFAIVAIIFIPACLWIKNKRQLVIFCVALGVIILSSLEVVHIIVIRYFSHFDYYFRNNFHSNQRFGITSLAYVIVEAFVIFMILKNYEMNENNKVKIITCSVGLTFAAFGLIMMPRFGIYERIAKFFQPFLIIAVPCCIEGAKSLKNQKLVERGIVFFSFVYYAYIIITNAYLIVPFQFWNS